MIQTWLQDLPHDGIRLSVRAAGERGRPVLLFLHGFPEAAWIWDEMLLHFSRPEFGGYRCVAPHLRGYADSSRPQDVRAYRPRHLVQDVLALIDAECGPGAPLAALVAHDWGGAIAWNVANQAPRRLSGLVILNAPHPGAFLRELQHNPAQQAASAYMNDLIAPGAAERLAQDDYAPLLQFFASPQPWLTPELTERYRALWRQCLPSALQYYAASPLRPARSDDPGAAGVSLPPEAWRIEVPTLLLWGQEDHALLPALCEGLTPHVPDLAYVPIEGASHWLLHEVPERIRQEISDWLPKRRQ